MKVKPVMRKYCPRCNTHTEHTVSIYKKGKDRKLAEGNRRITRKKKGYGSFPAAIQKRFSKTTKKTVLKYKCKVCGHITMSKGMRLRKVEFIRM